MKYGFLGAGNMASAIIKGMVANGIPGEDILTYDIFPPALETLHVEYGCTVIHSAEDLVNECDVLVLAVKPHVLDKIIYSVKKDIRDNSKIIISIAVGKTLDYLEKDLGKDKKLVRIMPNINAKVMQATSGYCCNHNITAEDEQIVVNMFSCVGTITKIPENLFSIFGVLAGSGPAFVYMYIDSIARAAQKAGMPKAQALEIAASTVMGSAKMILESNEHPWQLVDSVCSPGGTTIEGVAALEDNCFQATVAKAFDAVLAKDFKIQSQSADK